MNEMNPDQNDERFHLLMTAALDAEISPEERVEFDRLLERSPARRREWEEYRKLKELTMGLRFNEPAKEVWEQYWVGVYNRVERRLGWTLVSIAAVILLTYAGFELVLAIIDDPEMPLLIRIAMLSGLAGGFILFVSVVREKLFTHKRDKYREVQR